MQYGPEVECGKDRPNYFLTATDPALATNHQLSLNKELLTSGQYHFIVKSTDSGGNTALSTDASFSVNTIEVKAKVINQEDKSVKGAKVTLGCSSGTTDQNGQTTLKNVPALKKIEGTVEHKGKKTTIMADTAALAAASTPGQLTFRIKTSKSPLLAVAAVLGALSLILLSTGYIIRRHNMGLGLKPGPRAAAGEAPAEKIISPSSSQTPSSVITPTAPPPVDPTDKLKK